MVVQDYQHYFFKLKPYEEFSDKPPLMFQYFIRRLNGCIIGAVKVFQPKTLKEVVIKDTLVEENLTLGHDEQVRVQTGVPKPSGYRGNCNTPKMGYKFINLLHLQIKRN